MALDPEYLDAIKGFEGYSPNAAWDYKQSSSGYGTKAQSGDENIPPDQLQAVHEQRYQAEIAKARAALTSLTYNAGPGWSQSGLGEMVRSGDLQGAATRFLEYNKAGGEVLPGLVARRAKEAAWFTATPQGAPAAPAAPANTPPVNTIPQQPPPIFAQAPQPQAQGGGGGPAPFEQIPPMQSAPIFTPPRRQIDLSKLRAALAQSRGFSFRG